MTPIDAWLNVASGTVIPRNKANESFGRKVSVMPIKAILNEAGNAYINANGDANVANAVNSKSLERIIGTLKAVNEQRNQLIASALAVAGGEDALKALELYDTKVDGQVAKEPTPKTDPELDAMMKKSRAKVPAKKDGEINL